MRATEKNLKVEYLFVLSSHQFNSLSIWIHLARYCWLHRAQLCSPALDTETEPYGGKMKTAEDLHVGGKRFSWLLTHKICHKADTVEGYCHQPLINI